VRPSAVIGWAIAIHALACGGEGDDEVLPVAPPVECVAGEWRRDDGACIAAGLSPDMPCPPGEWERDGECLPAGVPPDGCAEGFVHDGDRGCDPILPREPCAPGFIAIPGESTCREVALCAAGTWGDIPVENDTEYVDAGYAGMDSDGSAPKPWTTIQDAVDAAAPGAIVAIAAGSYLEDVAVSGKAVRLWGVCPALVEVQGTGAELAAVQVLSGAANTEVHSLAIGGSVMGVFSSGSLDVLLERVWVHDNGERAIDFENDLGPTSLAIRDSLVEWNQEVGVFANDAEVTVETSVVRNTLPNAQGLFGHGLSMATTGAPATLLLRRSVVEQSREAGMLLRGLHATVEASVVRGTLTNAQGIGGRGVSAQVSSTTGVPTTLQLRTSVIAENHETGVFLSASEATVEATVVRDVLPDAFLSGRGVSAQVGSTPATPSKLLLRTSLLDRCQETGVLVGGSEVTLEASAIRDTLPGLELISQGVTVLAIDNAPATLTMHASLVERSRQVGVLVVDAQATIDASVVRDTSPTELGLFGRGIGVEDVVTTALPSTLRLRNSLVEQNHEFGLFVGAAEATVETSVVRDTLPDAQGFFGRGVNAQAEEMGQPAKLLLRGVLVERSHDMGVFVQGSEATVDASIVRDVQPNVRGAGGRGVSAEAHPITYGPSTLLFRASLMEQGNEFGVAVVGSQARIEASTIRDIAANALGKFGDGMIVVSERGPATATITAIRIERSARAALSVHGGHATIAGSSLSCQAFDLDFEKYGTLAAKLEDLGGNLCGCPEAKEVCKAVSAGLEAPPAAPP